MSSTGSRMCNRITLNQQAGFSDDGAVIAYKCSLNYAGKRIAITDKWKRGMCCCLRMNTQADFPMFNVEI